MSIFYLDYENGNDSTTNTPLGWWSVAYTAGNGTEPVADELATGGTSLSTAYVNVVVVSSGTWAGGDAAGTIYWYGKSDAFESETLTFGEGATCSIGGDFTYCAWKTITAGPTAARIAPGDETRAHKSPPSTGCGTAEWTNLSKTVTIQALTGCTFTDSGSTKVRVTKTAHNLQTGDVVVVSATESGTYDGTYVITYVSSSTFDLDGTTYSADKTGTCTPQLTLTVDNCETAWTANGSGDCTVTRIAAATDAKQGDYCMKFALDSSVQTSVMQAYYEISETDFSSYQKLSFWIKNEAAIVDGASWKFCLCSDTAGATIVDTFWVPAIPSTARWACITVAKDGGGNLGSSIKSVAVWTGTTAPTASKYIYLDNIIACTTNGLNLQSLISKNTLEQSTVAATGYGNEGWYGIQSIDGVTVLLDNETNTKSTAGRGYSGTTETVATYKRETIKTDLAAASTTQVQTIQDEGTSYSSMIIYSGGWDTSTNLQTGETFFDGLNGYGFGIYVWNLDYINLTRLSFCRYYYGVYTRPCFYHILDLSHLNNNFYGVYYYDSHFPETNAISINNNGSGITFGPAASRGKVSRIVNLSNNLTTGLSISTIELIIGQIDYGRNNGTYAIDCVDIYATDINTSDNGIVAIRGYWGEITRLTSAESTAISKLDEYRQRKNQFIGVNSLNGGYAKCYFYYGTIIAQDTTRHTASGVAWQMSPTNSARNSDYPLELSLAKIKVNASSEVTVTCWCKLSHATDVGAKLIIKGGQIAGVTTDVSDTKAEDTDWEQLSISFTPTEEGVVEIIGQGYWRANTADDSIYFDDLDATQV